MPRSAGLGGGAGKRRDGGRKAHEAIVSITVIAWEADSPDARASRVIQAIARTKPRLKLWGFQEQAYRPIANVHGVWH